MRRGSPRHVREGDVWHYTGVVVYVVEAGQRVGHGPFGACVAPTVIHLEGPWEGQQGVITLQDIVSWELLFRAG